MADDNEERGLDLNATDFFIWDYGKLLEYQKELINIVASLESQVDRNTMRLQYYDLISEFGAPGMVKDFNKVFDERWRKNVTFSLTRAKLLLNEVTRRCATMEPKLV